MIQSLLLKTRRRSTSESPNWRMGLLEKRLTRLRLGTLRVTWPGGRKSRFSGPEPGPDASLNIHSPRLVNRLLRSGALGLAESYIEGGWDSPDLRQLLLVLHLNTTELTPASPRLQAVSSLVQRFRHYRHRNSRRGSRRNIAYHYDLGNDFYRLWLDETWTYSCAFFAGPDDTLADAQRRKYRNLLARLQPTANDHILEIGCGWGGFALHAAAHTGCRVTGLTLSEEQLRFAQQRADAARLADRVTFLLCDYRDVEGQYDHVASIEMAEAVGETYWPVYFRTIRERLKPGGRAALQTITIAEEQFATYRREVDFIQRHIFPGGMLPSPQRFRDAAASQGLICENSTFHGADYHRTLNCWDERVVAAGDAIVSLYNQRFWRMWRYYLAYSAVGFASGNIDLMQTTLMRMP